MQILSELFSAKREEENAQQKLQIALEELKRQQLLVRNGVAFLEKIKKSIREMELFLINEGVEVPNVAFFMIKNGEKYKIKFPTEEVTLRKNEQDSVKDLLFKISRDVFSGRIGQDLPTILIGNSYLPSDAKLFSTTKHLSSGEKEKSFYLKTSNGAWIWVLSIKEK